MSRLNSGKRQENKEQTYPSTCHRRNTVFNVHGRCLSHCFLHYHHVAFLSQRELFRNDHRGNHFLMIPFQDNMQPYFVCVQVRSTRFSFLSGFYRLLLVGGSVSLSLPSTTRYGSKRLVPGGALLREPRSHLLFQLDCRLDLIHCQWLSVKRVRRIIEQMLRDG